MSKQPMIGDELQGTTSWLRAKVLDIDTHGSVTLERWDSRKKKGRRARFVLSMSYLLSERCGWKLIAKELGR